MLLEDICSRPGGPASPGWGDGGYVIAENLIDDAVLTAYEQEWMAVHGTPPDCAWGAWQAFCTPYVHHPALQALCCDGRLAQLLEQTVGEPMGVHLNLTGWQTTTRDWHADQLLSPPEVGDRYAAAWIALENIHPDSGPFQFIAGSHLWPQVDATKLRALLTVEENADPLWPAHAERILTPLFEQYIEEQDAPVVTYLPRRGDTLLWHPRLLHRGSRATVDLMPRRALIAHFSHLDRADFPSPAVQHVSGGWYFPWP